MRIYRHAPLRACIQRDGRSAIRSARIPSRREPGFVTVRQPVGVSCTRERGSMMVSNGKINSSVPEVAVQRGRWSPCST